MTGIYIGIYLYIYITGMYKAIWTGRHGFHILFYLEKELKKQLGAQELDYHHVVCKRHIVDAQHLEWCVKGSNKIKKLFEN